MDAFEKLCGMTREEIFEADFKSYRTSREKDSYIQSIYDELRNTWESLDKRYNEITSTLRKYLN